MSRHISIQTQVGLLIQSSSGVGLSEIMHKWTEGSMNTAYYWAILNWNFPQKWYSALGTEYNTAANIVLFWDYY